MCGDIPGGMIVLIVNLLPVISLRINSSGAIETVMMRSEVVVSIFGVLLQEIIPKHKKDINVNMVICFFFIIFHYLKRVVIVAKKENDVVYVTNLYSHKGEIKRELKVLR